mgnify:FL=1
MNLSITEAKALTVGYNKWKEVITGNPVQFNAKYWDELPDKTYNLKSDAELFDLFMDENKFSN